MELRTAAVALALASLSPAAYAQGVVYDTLDITANGLYNRAFGNCIGTVPMTSGIADLQLADDFTLSRAAPVTRVVADYTSTGAPHAPDAVWVQFFANNPDTSMPLDETFADAIVSGNRVSVIDLGILTVPPPYNFGVRFSVDLRPDHISLPAGTWWVSIQPVDLDTQSWYWILRRLDSVVGAGEAARNGGTHHTGEYGGYPGVLASPDGDNWRRLGDIGFRFGTVPMRIEAGCAADLTGDGVVNVSDFLSYLQFFAAADPRADWDGSGGVNIQDFLGYVAAYSAGCV